METAAFLNLPMQTSGLRVIHLNPVNAEIVFARYRIFSVDQWQREEWPTVVLPGREYGQFIQPCGLVDHFGDRSSRNISCAELQNFCREAAMFPKLSRFR